MNLQWIILPFTRQLYLVNIFSLISVVIALWARLNHELGEARPQVHLSGELQVDRLANDHLGCGEHLQISQHVTTNRPALGVRQADVEVGVPVQRADQGDDLEPPAEVQHLRERLTSWQANMDDDSVKPRGTNVLAFHMKFSVKSIFKNY